MLNPEDREIYACVTCKDFKRIYVGVKDAECHECAAWPPEKRNQLIIHATKTRSEKPSIRITDLDDEEKAIFDGWVETHPHVHALTLLTWIEGRRYDPKNDPEFLAEARKRFKKWHFLRNTNEGRLPGWVEYALSTGDLSNLNSSDRQYVQSLKDSQTGPTR